MTGTESILQVLGSGAEGGAGVNAFALSVEGSPQGQVSVPEFAGEGSGLGGFLELVQGPSGVADGVIRPP